MTEELKNVIEVVDDLKATNLVNVQILRKALDDINLRLEEMYDGDELVFFRNSLGDFKKTLDTKFDNIFETLKDLKSSVQDDSGATENAELMEGKLKSLFSIFDSSIKLLTTKVETIEGDFSKIAEANAEIAKQGLTKISEELKIHQQEIIENHKTFDEGTIERFTFVAESIKLISENINIQTGIYKEFVEKKVGEIKDFVETSEDDVKKDNAAVCSKLEGKFKELEKENAEFSKKLEAIKTSVVDVLEKAEEIPQITSQNFNVGLKSVTEIAQDALIEIKVLQDYSGNLIKSVNKILEFTDKDSKMELLESQITEMKTMFSELAANIQDKEVELLQRESEKVQEYYEKIETVSDSLLKLEESLKLSGVEYKESIVSLNHELTEFIGEFNTIYNEVSEAAQVKINNSLEELKQFMSENSANYSNKLVDIQEQFAQSFKDLYQVLVETKEFDEAEKEVTEAHSKLLESISAKIDIIANNDMTSEVLSLGEETQELVEQLNTKVDTLLNIDFQAIPDKQMLINRKFFEYLQGLNDKTSDLSSTNKNLLQELHSKLDIFVSTNDNELLGNELSEIKDIILEQQELLGNKNHGVLSENIGKLLVKIDGISDTISEYDENSAKIKEDLVHTIVSVFSNANFVEESEDIKDFVEEKTDELSKQLIDVKSQIETIRQNEVVECSYSLADVENDIAKLRQALTVSGTSAEFNQISRNIHNLTSSVDAISKNLTPAEIYQLKHNILKLNDDILSISSRTNKLLLNSDESQKTIADGLTAFSHIAFNLEERMNELSNKEFNVETTTRLEKLLALAENSASMDSTFHKVMMYLGEWVDAASETIENINDKADVINEVSEALSELRKAVPEKIALIELLEERFEEQQSRMDRLENKIDELTEMTKLNSNLSIVQKVDKMEGLLATLNANIEKLTSYVD